MEGTLMISFLSCCTEQQLIDFHLYLNSTNPNIKLGLDYSNTGINFLDLKTPLTATDIYTHLFTEKVLIEIAY